MNLKLVLAAALFVSTGTFVAQAQTKTVTAKTATSTAAKAFEKKIAAFKAETDDSKAAILYRELTMDMSTGLGSAKAALTSAQTDEQKAAANAKYNEKATALNETNKAFRADPKNKTAIVEGLHKYAQTL